MSSLNSDELRERIFRDPTLLEGQPVVRGTTVQVAQVLARLADHIEPSVLDELPGLTAADVRACLAYAQDAITATSPQVSPEAFYSGLTCREDIRQILSALAK